MVHLRSVRLRGFKTFAKPTELVFEPGVTVIIGPNGSGKSNIADAVLWVLGEQSPGNLRGRSMQDVIFSGPDGRRSSAVAEVSLVFDNDSGSLPLEWAELEVTRRLARDTGSEYRLNGNGCRLLDVQDVVGGLGLGREMHSVVSQGRVEAFLSSTPEARRAMVEEAAGLGRFKKRRERAQAKLEKTRQNLARAADIEREVKSALRPLRQQVVAAEKFAEATEDWALAKGRVAMQALVEARGASGVIQERLQTAETRREQIEAVLAELRAERALEEESFSAALKERERLGDVFHRTKAGADYLDSRVASLRQRLARLEGDTDRARRRCELAESEAASLAGRLEAMMAATADEQRLVKVGGWAERLRGALEAALPAYRAAVAAEDELKDSVYELEAARSRGVQDREFLRRETEERGRVSGELAVLTAEASAHLERLEAEEVALQRKLTAAEDAVLAEEAELRAAAAAREEARAAADEVLGAEVGLAEISAGLEARQAVLEHTLARREGIPEGARALLVAELGSRPLTDVLQVKPGYERALAAALGPLSQAVVVPEECDIGRVLRSEGALEAIWGVESERPAMQPGSPPRGTIDLWEAVTGPQPVMGALRRLVPPTAVLVDADRLHDWPLRAEGDVAGVWRLVSRGGEVLEPGIHVARRQELGAETLFKARNELAEAGKELEELSERRVQAREAAERAAAGVGQAEDLYRRREESLRAAERLLTALRGDHDLHVRRLEETRLQSAELRARREREDGVAEQMLVELRSVEQTVAVTEDGLEKARSALREHQSEVESLRRSVGRMEEKKGQAALVEVRLRERCRSHESEKTRMLAQRDMAVQEVARCKRRESYLAGYVPVVSALLSVAVSLAEQARAAASQLESLVGATRVDADDAARLMRDRGNVETGHQRELDALATQSADLRVEEARLDERRSLLEEELVELRRRHLSPRGLTPADVAGQDAASLQAAVERAERRRDRIGPVNPLAEQECAEMEERAHLMEEQRGDLETSLAQLGDVIAELDEHIESVFTEIFEATRENFSSVIAAVFPGAKGALKLTEPKAGSASSGDGEEADAETDETLLDGSKEGEPVGGITLEVKFPNKSPRSLSLLSGGEKAMTAIAFLFSLFLARPCPFYILDEVEASLDDINIRRFLSLVRKYRERTQFIIITHQRQTMEVADTLYGVTLENDGTSRVLSRRLAQAKGA